MDKNGRFWEISGSNIYRNYPGSWPPSDLTFTMPSECEVFSGGLRELSRITHQLGKCDLEPKSGFPDATGRSSKQIS